jgi:cation diffusion facilitator family transporter
MTTVPAPSPVTDATPAKKRAALLSVIASGGLAGAKLVVALLTGSLALLAEAMHSMIDFGATLMTLWAVSVADKPADDTHHYGHTKMESLSALVETGLLAGASVWILWEGVQRLTAGTGPESVHPAAMAILVVAIVVDWFRVRSLKRIAAETQSQALEAGALHFASDMGASAVVLVGLGFVWFGYPMADALAAIVVAVFVLSASLQLGKKTIDTLTDAAPAGAADLLTSAADAVEGVVGVDRVRVRPGGSKLFADVDVTVPRTRPTEEVVAIKAKVKEAIESEARSAGFGDLEANVIAHPVTVDDESALQQVLHVARLKGVPVHHITIKDVKGVRVVTFDVEVDGRLTLDAAHDIATDLEDAIERELGAPVEVEAHIEPLQAHRLAGIDAGFEDIERITDLLNELARGGPVRDVHAVRVRWTEDGPVVNFHAVLDPRTSVSDAHDAVDTLERALKAREPGIARAVGHAEPEGAH